MDFIDALLVQPRVAVWMECRCALLHYLFMRITGDSFMP